ncbi:MAG: AAA family ATPase [Chitinivibrionales bacterium]|nr:AAA family ATPase [Chitinivibrionales bacterium]
MEQQQPLSHLYVSATLQDTGKTSISLGLMQALLDRGFDPGYIKPVGQRYVQHLGHSIDEDAYLFHEVFRLRDRPKLMSPIAVRRRFTREYIERPDGRKLEQSILRSRDRLGAYHNALLIEGTGHAGVGSCFGLSNARVAQLLGAKAIIVAGGGIGKPIDEVALSMSLFARHGVEVIGVVLNKVHPRKYDEVVGVVRKGLPLIGTRLLGAVPHVRTLTNYTLEQVAEEFDYPVLCGRKGLANRIENTVVLAMRPEHSRKYIRENTLVITPVDRLESIQTAIATLKNFSHAGGGIILTGSSRPDPQVQALLRESDIPVLASKDDTFTVSSRMVHLEFKIRAADGDKIRELRGLVARHVDIDALLKELQPDADSAGA